MVHFLLEVFLTLKLKPLEYNTIKFGFPHDMNPISLSNICSKFLGAKISLIHFLSQFAQEMCFLYFTIYFLLPQQHHSPDLHQHKPWHQQFLHFFLSNSVYCILFCLTCPSKYAKKSILTFLEICSAKEVRTFIFI